MDNRTARYSPFLSVQLTAKLVAIFLLACLVAVGALLIVDRGFPNLLLCGTCGDFKNAYQAAQIARQGGDPYDSVYQLYRYHFPPALLVILRPLTSLPIDSAFIIWTIFMATAVAISIWLLMRVVGKGALVSFATLSPVLLLALETGQPLPLMLLGRSAAVVALSTERYTLAGLCLSISWMKPQVALLATIAILVMTPRSIPGFVGGSIVFLLPPPLQSWLDVIAGLHVEHEPFPASIAGLWPGLFGAHELGYWLLALGACGASILVFRAQRDATQRMAWLMLIWFIAAPYSHPYDLTLLIVPVALVIDANIFLLNCWICSFLSFYTISIAPLVPPMLLIAALVQRCPPDAGSERRLDSRELLRGLMRLWSPGVRISRS